MKKTLSAEEEFLKAFENIEAVEHVEDLRAYYDAEGKVWTFAASAYPQGDQWIAIDRKLYETHDWHWLWVVDGKIVERRPNYNYYFPLTPSDKGVKVVKYHASVVVEPHEEYQEVEYYERRNS